MAPGRDTFLALPDEKLLADCTVETYRSGGPGGQHRNKRDSAVRLTHRPTGAVATATERRSQHENRHRALVRLRRAIAIRVRQAVSVPQACPPGAGPVLVSPGEASASAAHSAEAAASAAKAGKAMADGLAKPGPAVPSAVSVPRPACPAVPSALGRALEDAGWPRISQKSETYLPAAAQALDFLEAMEGKTSDVAASLGTSTASLVKFLHLDDGLWEEANRIRKHFGHAPLR